MKYLETFSEEISLLGIYSQIIPKEQVAKPLMLMWPKQGHVHSAVIFFQIPRYRGKKFNEFRGLPR